MSSITGIDHIDIVVQNPVEMANYLIGIGFVHHRTARGGTSIELRVPGEAPQPILELNSPVDEQGKQRPLGLQHLALRTDDLQGLYRGLLAKGLTFTSEPRDIPATGRTLVNLAAPEGIVQLVQADE